MRKVAVTGGLSSGKSVVCQLLKGQGAYVVSADEIAHDLLASDETVYKKVVNLLGPSVLSDGQLNRKVIAKKVFSNPELLLTLEQILHPAIFHAIESHYQSVQENPDYAFFVAEVPLLYETNSQSLFDAIVVVLAPDSLCKERFNQRNQEESSAFTSRMNRQMAPAKKAEMADFVLVNSGSLEELKEQVETLAAKLKRRSFHQ